MNFYEVALSDRGLKTHQTLTYSCENDLAIGSMVRVGIRNRMKNGIIVSKVSKPKYKTKQIEKNLPGAPVEPRLIELAKWMADFYAVDLGTCIGLLIPQGLEKKRRAAKEGKELPNTKNKVSLNADQQKVADQILKKSGSYLLRGITGSGKTRVYIEVALQARENGLGSIVLVPEIGLTSQMVDEFRQYFSDDIFVIHSNQSEADRHKQWLAIQKAKTPIVIGPRSALFSPVAKLGLIVIDEEHETSYKQDISPKYHAVRVAAKLRQLSDATLVLGSATPSVEDYYMAEKSEAKILSLTKPAAKTYKTHAEIVDIKKRDRFTTDQWISDPLLHAIKTALSSDKQVILFHNRRGNSTSVVCRSCGWVATCPNCDLPLTHHADWGSLVCHICNHREPVRSNCPSCGEAELVYRGLGTKELVSTTQKHFPDAKIERFDSDVTSKQGKLEERYQSLVKGHAQIIIGTQMIAKGLDLPKLGVVGIVLADTALYLPDYSSNERTYQLISQVMGRTGRHQDGQVVIQTYNPTSPAIQNAISKNWPDFYKAEVEDRRIAQYPPHVFMLKLTIEERTDSDAQQSATELATAIRNGVKEIDVLGPTPAFHHKTRSGWRWQVVVKSQDRHKLTNIARQLPPKWQFELDPINLL